MIERETRNFQVWSIGFPSHPDFLAAYQLLWDEFGPHGGMERLEAVKSFLLEDPYEPTSAGTFMRYFLLVAKDDKGEILGARDGVLLLLGHLFVLVSSLYVGTLLYFAAKAGSDPQATLDMAMQLFQKMFGG